MLSNYEQVILDEDGYDPIWKVNHPDCPVERFEVAVRSKRSSIAGDGYVCTDYPITVPPAPAATTPNCKTININDEVFYHKDNYEFDLIAV